MIVNPEALESELRGQGGAALPLSTSSLALAASIVVKSGAGLLYGFTVYSDNASAQFVQVFDQATLPADGAVPDVVISVAATSSDGRIWIPPRPMLRGIVLCNSSTAATKTIGTTDCFFAVDYV